MVKTNGDESSKGRILTAATTLFARQGYASTGMRELAEMADVNLAMINYFFGNKKELLKIILDDLFSGYIEILEHEVLCDAPLDHKIERFIHRAVGYLTEKRDALIITMSEMPHDDPDITEHKAKWARKAMAAIQQGVCVPVKAGHGVDISPAAIGPLLISMMSSRFLVAPILDEMQPPGYGPDFIEQYPDIIATMFLSGINGLVAKRASENG